MRSVRGNYISFHNVVGWAPDVEIFVEREAVDTKIVQNMLNKGLRLIGIKL